MATIHVKEKFTFTAADGTGTLYAVGTHTGVPADVAKHPFVKAHCTDLPLNDEKDNGAALLALQTVIGERDAQIGDLASQLAEANETIGTLNQRDERQASLFATERDIARSERNALTAERDKAREDATTLAAQLVDAANERDTLANQVAELQAGGTPAKKK